MCSTSRSLFVILGLGFLLFTIVVHDTYAMQNILDIVLAVQKNNSVLLAADQDLKFYKLHKLKAMYGFLPQIYMQGIVLNIKSDNNQLSNYVLNNSQQGKLIISQELFAGGTTLSLVKRVNCIIEAAKAKFIAIRDSIIYEAIDVYENVILTRQLYQIALNKEKMMRQHLQIAELKFSMGELTKNDILAARYNVIEATAESERMRGDMSSAEAAFTRVIGMFPDKHLKSINTDVIQVPNSMNEFAAIVSSANPNLVLVKKNLDAAKYDIAASTGKLFPKVEFQGTLMRSGVSKNYKNYKNIDELNIALIVKLPVFENGLLITEIREKRHIKRKMELDFNNMYYSINEDVVNIWTKYQVAKYIARLSREALSVAQNYVISVGEEYKAGAKLISDVMTAENNLAKAKVSIRNAEKDLRLIIFQMHNYMGSISKLDFTKISRS